MKNMNMQVPLLMILFGFLGTGFVSQPKGTMPKGFVPMWSSQKGGTETCAINTSQIVRIVPVLIADESELTSTNEKFEPYLDVFMSDGIKLQVFEPYKEFKSRIRSSQR